jgi:hypothetical protein
LLRYQVLGGIGGYGAMSVDTLAKMGDVPSRLWFIFRDSLGPGWMGITNCFVLIAAVGLGWRNRRPFHARFGFAGTLVLLLPVAPLLLIDNPYGLHRALILVGWGLVVLVVWLLEGSRLRFPTLAALAIAANQASIVTVSQLQAAQRVERAQFDFLVAGPSTTDLVPHQFRSIGYLEAMRRVRRNVTGEEAPLLVTEFEELAALGAERGRRAMAWSTDCYCVEPLGAKYDASITKFQNGVMAGHNGPLQVELSLEDFGRVKVLGWQVLGSSGTTYLEVKHFGRYDITSQGKAIFGLDTTVMLPPVVPVRAIVETVDGAIVRSAWLNLRLSGTNSVKWSSISNEDR